MLKNKISSITGAKTNNATDNRINTVEYSKIKQGITEEYVVGDEIDEGDVEETEIL